MLSRETAIRQALSDLEARHVENTQEEERRRLEVAKNFPQIEEKVQERQGLLKSGLQMAFQSPQEAGQISQRMREKTQALNTEIRKMLGEAGLPEDYLQPVYTCPLCRDTGYVGEPVHELCSCMRSRILAIQYRDEGMQILQRQNFDAFDDSVFPDTPVPGKKDTQRQYMKKAAQFCRKYADGFENARDRGLVITGASGLGKTFLMNCICQRLLEKGHGVVILSAYRLAELLRMYQYDGSGAEQVQDLLSADLLAVDDLGSEPQSRNITGSGIYYIVSERMNAGKALLVTTNCDPDALYERYGDRIAARLCDPSRMQVLSLYGEDVRRFLRRS